ncbi:GGDEF domain-containing protein [Parachitinimonas caeni]|uniref:diguanylate cyclase n=1 Tax=Parachitinimonas caeni TaxID=3031301 RepID=A0ABT7DWA5_9NEIS|nr:GGDEF domain-containing protein [Parachitinimonas caeni]MDK2122937.1 GGDEF domain-containing protein [Parachitinimonas caeni]
MLEEDDLVILGSAPLFEGVEVRGWASRHTDLRVVTLQGGQALLDPLHANEHIYVLLSGELEVLLRPTSETPVARLTPGSCTGDISMIDDKPPTAYVVAASDCRVLPLNRAKMWALMAEDHRLAYNLLQVLAQRMRANNELILQSLELQERYRAQAETDALTGLHSRAWLEDIFPRQVDLSSRIGQPLTLLMIDVDHFKRVNDLHGHPIGDLALRHVAGLVRANLRSADLSARYGGEEFTALLVATDLEQAINTAERLRERIQETPLHLPNGQLLPLTVSIGAAQARANATLAELLAAADRALYQAKQAGRNRVRAAGRTPVVLPQ